MSVVRNLMAMNGHCVVSPDEADIICVSVCDVTQVKFVESVRRKYPDKKIVVGGHAAIYYKLFGLFADYVALGQGFEFFKCQSVGEFSSLPSVWHKDKADVLIPSTLIEWGAVPIANVTQKQRYYLGAVGCKNKCKFCMTSWTNPHQRNDDYRVKAAMKKYPNITVVTNDSDNVASRMTQSIMLLDFLKKPLKKYGVYRIGVEFATEESRKKYGKLFTDAQFCEMVQRAVGNGVRLKLFCIGGINTIDEWRGLFSQIPPIFQKGNFEIKFTNITYDMFTPMKFHRYEIDIDRMFDTKKAHDFVTELKLSGGWPFKALPTSGVKDTLLRNALCYTTNADEYALYNELRMPKVEKERVLSAVLNVFFKNDYSASVKINHRASIEYEEKRL
jgi:hypothetical protein